MSDHRAMLGNPCYAHIRGRVTQDRRWSGWWFWEVWTINSAGERVALVAQSDETSFAGAFEAAEAGAFVARAAFFYGIHYRSLVKPQGRRA